MFRENVTMENVTLTPKEQQRLRVLNEVNLKKLSLKQAAMIMELSLRHTKRLLSAYRKEGALALAHGNRGHAPVNALDEDIRERVVALARTKYTGFNHQHLTEKLFEQEGIPLSRSSVRRILLKQGITSPRKRRAPKHRSRRQRYPQAGMLLQTDGSPHDWLEGRGPHLCLIGAIDDATNEVPYAHFRDQEDTLGYMRMLREITLKQGVPLALYHDQHSIFEISSDKLPSLEEQLAGKKPLTQLGRLLEELGITSISANSPQAKGRVERLWKTFQDRLCSELRLAGACNQPQANQVLEQFLPEYNRKFKVQAQEPGSAYRPLPSDCKEEACFCLRYSRMVGADNVIRFEQQRWQILPSVHRQSYARCQVEVRISLDNQLGVYYDGQALDIRPAPVETTALRKAMATPVAIHAANPTPESFSFHPWRQWVHR
jgi:transposase